MGELRLSISPFCPPSPPLFPNDFGEHIPAANRPKAFVLELVKGCVKAAASATTGEEMGLQRGDDAPAFQPDRFNDDVAWVDSVISIGLDA